MLANVLRACDQIVESFGVIKVELSDPTTIVCPEFNAQLAVAERQDGVMIQSLCEGHLIVHECRGARIIGRAQLTNQMPLD